MNFMLWIMIITQDLLSSQRILGMESLLQQLQACYEMPVDMFFFLFQKIMEQSGTKLGFKLGGPKFFVQRF